MRLGPRPRKRERIPSFSKMVLWKEGMNQWAACSLPLAGGRPTATGGDVQGGHLKASCWGSSPPSPIQSAAALAHLSSSSTPTEGRPGRRSVPFTPCSCTTDRQNGLRANEEDCRRVFTTSNGQVRMAPAVPPNLEAGERGKAKWGLIYSGYPQDCYTSPLSGHFNAVSRVCLHVTYSL